MNIDKAISLPRTASRQEDRGSSFDLHDRSHHLLALVLWSL